jgi:hypothetical protein
MLQAVVLYHCGAIVPVYNEIFPEVSAESERTIMSRSPKTDIP